MSILSQRIRAEREQRGLKQIQAAKLLGLHPNTYQCYENGSCNPPLPILTEIAMLFLCPIDYLSGRTNKKIVLTPKEGYCYTEFPNQLRNARMQTGMLQKDVANAIGVSVTSYACYELNIRRPSYEHFIALADLFSVSCDSLLGWHRKEDGTNE